MFVLNCLKFDKDNLWLGLSHLRPPSRKLPFIYQISTHALPLPLRDAIKKAAKGILGPCECPFKFVWKLLAGVPPLPMPLIHIEARVRRRLL